MTNSQPQTVDGRRARGQKRRSEIIDATLTVVTRDGAAGVTHRSVAQEAGTTASLCAYYFSTLDELLVAALTSVADIYSAKVREILDGDDDKLRGLAQLIVDSDGPGRERALAERELATLAARRPALAPVARRWRDDIAQLAGHLTDNQQAVASLVATSDGLCTAVLIGNIPVDIEYVYGILVRSLGLNHDATD